LPGSDANAGGNPGVQTGHIREQIMKASQLHGLAPALLGMTALVGLAASPALAQQTLKVQTSQSAGDRFHPFEDGRHLIHSFCE
jgi:hypothetical protein